MSEILRALNRLIIHMATIAFFDLRNIVTCSKVDNRIYKRIQDNPFINLWRKNLKKLLQKPKGAQTLPNTVGTDLLGIDHFTFVSFIL